MSKERVKNLLLLYYEKYAAVPTQKYLSSSLNISLEEVTKALQELKKQGFIQYHNKRYFIPDISMFKQEKKSIKQHILRIGWKDYITIDNFIRVIMFLISSAAIVISIYYTRFWLLNYLNPFYSTLLSAAMVIYATFSFQGLRKIKSVGIKAGVVITAVIVILFSMVSTVAGQYNNRIIIEEEHKESTNGIEQYERWRNEEKMLAEQLTIKNEEIQGLNEILDSVNDIEKRKEYGWYFWDTAEKIKAIKEEIKNIEAEKKAVAEKIEGYLSQEEAPTEKKIRQPFYEWLSEIVKVPDNYVEFWLSVFPAVFIDIIAPLGMLVALRKKRDDD